MSWAIFPFSIWMGVGIAPYVDGMTCETPSAERIYSRKEAAKRLGVTTQTLAKWAVCRRGPQYSRSGDVRGRVLYRESDIQRWLDERRQEKAG